MIEAKSFGVIPIFKGEGRIRIVIVKNKNGDHWGLPKGTPEAGEMPIETAKRETAEETGITDFKIDENKNFEEKYIFEARGNIYNKTNTYYLGFVEQMEETTFADDIAEVRWVSFDEARKILSHQTAIDLINKVEGYLNSKD